MTTSAKRGRKPSPPDQKTRPRSVRLNDARWEKFKALHKDDPEWLAKKIDKAKTPPTPQSDGV